MLDDGYLQVTPYSAGSSITMRVGALDPNKKYILEYSTVGEGDMSIGAYLRYGGKPYKPISPLAYRKISSVRNDYELLLEPAVSQASGTLVLTVDQQKVYCLDNIQFHEADASVTNPDDYMRFEYNASSKNKIISIDGNYIDVNRKSYSNKVELAPYSSIILLKENTGLTKTSVGSIKESVMASAAEEMDLSGVLQDNRIDLRWRSSSGTNAGFFEVEGSDDGEKFSKIGTGETSRNADSDHIYKYSDETPSVGWNFYRIKRGGDHKNASAFSNVINVYYRDSEGLKVYPNPANHLLNVSCDAMLKSQTAAIYIMTVSGQVILTVPVAVSGRFDTSVDLSDLHGGTYIAKLVWENLVLYKKFVRE